MGWRRRLPWSEIFRTNASDFVTQYSTWNPIRTQTPVVTIPISRNLATVELTDPEDDVWSIGGAVTAKSKVPTSGQFDENDDQTERNLWTATSDFYATERFNGTGGHHGIFLRVNPKVWGGEENQTRFGCYINGKKKTRQGCLQLTGDRYNGSGKETEERFFTLTEDPFEDPDRRCRVQILEKEKKVNDVYKLHWRAEVHRENSDGTWTRIGYYDWVNEDTVRNSYNVDIPTLSGSKIMFGVGPARAGTVKIDRIATNYWTY